MSVDRLACPYRIVSGEARPISSRVLFPTKQTESPDPLPILITPEGRRLVGPSPTVWSGIDAHNTFVERGSVVWLGFPDGAILRPYRVWWVGTYWQVVYLPPVWSFVAIAEVSPRVLRSWIGRAGRYRPLFMDPAMMPAKPPHTYYAMDPVALTAARVAGVPVRLWEPDHG